MSEQRYDVRQGLAAGGVPVSLRVVLEPVLRSLDSRRITEADVRKLAHYLNQEFCAQSGDEDDTAQRALLTAREREILGLLAAGKTNPQIADQLIIGVGTVKTHTLKIYRKLNVANRSQAIVRGQQLRLLPAAAGV